jgi:pyrroline-5-carboxylate reductase
MARLGIIGATGWLGQALGLNLVSKRVWPEQDLVLLRRSGSGDAYAAYSGVTWARDAEELCDLCQTVVLSVRPHDFPVSGFRPKDHVLISFMAGWSLRQLQDLAPEARIFRAMPNGGATMGKSYTPWLAGPGAAQADKVLVSQILAAIGQEERLETEDQLHYLAGLSGSGGAYPGLMAQAMLADARAFGLPDAIANRAVEAVITGSVGLLAGRIDKVDALLDSYMSYQGITAAGLSAAVESGFQTALREALAAAFAKAKSMGAEQAE